MAHIRAVQINGLSGDALYRLHGCNSLLREPQTVYVSSSGDDNNGGFMLLCGMDSVTNAGVKGAIVRYNLSVNDGKSGLNIFDVTGSVSDSQIYNNTVYCGKNGVEDMITVTGTISDDPKFANAGLESTGRETGAAYKVNNSGILNGGAVISNNGGMDYFGNAVSADSTLIGAIAG